jgi:predicted PurR-regulated permease PerM
MGREIASSESTGILTMASACVVVAALYLGREFLVPVAVAILLAFLLAPVVNAVERLHFPRVPAVITVVLLTFIIMGSVGWLIYNQLEDFAGKVTSYEGQIREQAQSLQKNFFSGPLGKISEEFDKVAKSVATSMPDGMAVGARGTPGNPVSVAVQSVDSPRQDAVQVIGSALNIVAPLAQTVIIVVFVVFILLQHEDLRDRLIRLIGHGQLTLTTQALDEAATRVSRYLLRQTLINVSIGVIIGFGLFILGIPNAPLWGLLCGLLRFIPYVGIWIGALFPILLSLVVHPGHAGIWPLLTIGLFVVIELTTGNFIEPYIYGASTGVSALAILLAAAFWTWVWGGAGLLLSTPLTVVLVVLGKYVPRMEFLNILLGDQPVLEPYERYYQRLLADDSEEAETLLEEFEKTRTTEKLYSDILLPALQLAKNDHARGSLHDRRMDFIIQEMRDHIEMRRQRDLTQRQAEIAEGQLNNEQSKAKPDSEGALNRQISVNAKEDLLNVPIGHTINVLCVPAQDEPDEIAGLMITHLLEMRGYTTQCLTAAVLAGELVESITKFGADLVVISALPPRAVSHARYLCLRLQARFAKIPMLVGVWALQGDAKQMRDRISRSNSVQLAVNLADAVSSVHQMIQPMLVHNGDRSVLHAEANAIV